MLLLVSIVEQQTSALDNIILIALLCSWHAGRFVSAQVCVFIFTTNTHTRTSYHNRRANCMWRGVLREVYRIEGRTRRLYSHSDCERTQPLSSQSSSSSLSSSASNGKVDYADHCSSSVLLIWPRHSTHVNRARPTHKVQLRTPHNLSIRFSPQLTKLLNRRPSAQRIDERH